MANTTVPLALKGKYNEKKVKSFPLAAVKIFRGAIVVISTAGYANKPTNTAGEKMLGIALETVDNSAGAAGDKEIRVATDGMWNFVKSGTITQANAGQNVFASDDQTITQTVNNNWVGKVSHVESVGDSINTIWYDISEAALKQESNGGGADADVKIMPMTLAGLVNAQTRKLAIPFGFKLESIGFRTGTLASTAAKAATLTAQINGTPCTGGVISLTSANQATPGTLTAGTAVTALNTSPVSGGTLEVAVSGVTAFVEGDGWVEAVVSKI